MYLYLSLHFVERKDLHDRQGQIHCTAVVHSEKALLNRRARAPGVNPLQRNGINRCLSAHGQSCAHQVVGRIPGIPPINFSAFGHDKLPLVCTQGHTGWVEIALGGGRQVIGLDCPIKTVIGGAHVDALGRVFGLDRWY